jgi:hypothetical protein
VLISTATASSYLSPSDVANVANLPSSFVKSGVKYTTPALQGMVAHNIDIDWVRRTIGEHPLELSKVTVLTVDSVTMLFRKPKGEAPIELGSITI